MPPSTCTVDKAFFHQQRRVSPLPLALLHAKNGIRVFPSPSDERCHSFFGPELFDGVELVLQRMVTKKRMDLAMAFRADADCLFPSPHLGNQMVIGLGWSGFA